MADYSEKIEGMACVFSVEEKAIRAIVHPILVLLRMVHKQNVRLKEAVDEAQNASIDERGEYVKKICELLEPGNDDKANCSRKVLMRLKKRVIRFGHTGIIHELGEYLKADFDCVKESTAALFASLRAFYATEDLKGAWLAISRIFELLETSDGLFFASEESYAEEVEYAFSEFIRYCERNVQDLKEEFFSSVASLQAEVKGLRKDSKAADKGLRLLGRKTDAVLYEVSEDHAFGKPLTVSDQADEMRQKMLGEAICLVVDGGAVNLRAVARQIVEKYGEKRGGYRGESGIKALSEQLRRKLIARGIVAKAACEGAKTDLKKMPQCGKTDLKKTDLKNETVQNDEDECQKMEVMGKTDLKKVVAKVVETDLKKTDLKGTGQKILACMQVNAEVTIPELMRETGLSRTGVKYQLRVLKDGGYLRREGGRKMGHWVLVD